MNETTADGTITLEHAECLAACDYAPVVTVNYEFFDNQTVGSAMALVQQAARRASGRLPTRGAPLCTLPRDRAADRRIPRPEGGGPGVRTATGAPTEAGVRLASSGTSQRPSYANRDRGHDGWHVPR